MFLISILLFSICHRLVLCFGGPPPGGMPKPGNMPKAKQGYYVVNKGLDPTKLNGDPFSYDAHLTNGKPWEKRITATWIVHREVKKLGLNISFKMYDKVSGEWKISGEKIAIPDLCHSKFPMEPFLKKYNGTIDHNTCNVEPGHYYLSNWTFEEHMDFLPHVVLGEYKVRMCWLEKEQGCIMEQEILMEARDIKEKEADDRAGSVKKAKSDRKGKDKEKEGKENTEKKGKKSKTPEMPSMPEKGGKMPGMPKGRK